MRVIVYYNILKGTIIRRTHQSKLDLLRQVTEGRNLLVRVRGPRSEVTSHVIRVNPTEDVLQHAVEVRAEAFDEGDSEPG